MHRNRIIIDLINGSYNPYIYVNQIDSINLDNI